MVTTYVTQRVKKDVADLDEDCEYVYRKSHPELKHVYLSKSKLHYEIKKFYLQKTEKEIKNG